MKSTKSFKLSLVTLLGVTLLLSACSKKDQPTPVTPGTPPVQQPGPGTPPGTDVGTSLHTTRLTWAPLDWQEWTHDAAGQLVRYVSQYNWVQGTDRVRRLTYEFRYAPGGRLERLETIFSTGGSTYTVFRYEGEQLVGAEEFTSQGQLRVKYQFLFSNQNQLLEQLETYPNLTQQQVRYAFAYDPKGNLTEVQYSTRARDTEPFALATRMTYEQYDDRPVTPENQFHSAPYLPTVRFRVNNPGQRRIFGPNGQPLPGTERYTYAFDAAGRPAMKTVSGEGGTRTGEFGYGPKF